MRRLATPEDIDTVFALYMHEKVVPYLGYDPMPLEDFRAIYRQLLDGRDFFVYERDGRIAGFYRAARYPGRVRHVASLGTLAVDPALRFYEKLGFEREGTLRKFYKRAGDAEAIDDHVMALLVD
ncbi:GNAT family N-acetyltransferase [Variovorax sp.]|uniref:GNAT family N-acetyltransferase n=1 Tax=Variovorax sp. TaxID=1871043 RepID=UPI003BAA3937